MLTRDDLIGLGLRGLTDIEKDPSIWRYFLRMTSGTTGKTPILIARHIPEDPELILPSRKMLAAGGTLGFRGILIAMFFHAHRDTAEASIAVVTGDGQEGGLRAALEELQPDFIHGVTSFIVRLFSGMRGITLPHLRKITWGGEYVTDEALRALKESVPHAHIESWYGCAELGDLALPQCEYLTRFEFHPVRGVEVSVDSPDERGVGALLFSRALTRSVYAKEYRPGELGAVRREPCRCGAAVTFTVEGRADYDVVRVAGAILHVQECERVMATLARHVADYQVVARERTVEGNPMGQVTLRIAPADELRVRKDWQDFIAREVEKILFVTPTRTLGDLIAEGLFLPTLVEEVSSFAWGAKKIRLKRDG